MKAGSTKQKMSLNLNAKMPITKYQDLIALLCFVAAIIFYLWKAPYGFGVDDEGAYIAVAHRLTLGDSLLVDEWHPTQLIGFLLYLPLKAYIYLAGSTEGVVLFFRYLFVALQSTVASVIYCRLRKHGIFSILAALIFFVHIPLTSLMGMSYYAMGLAFVGLTGVLIATTSKCSKMTFFLSGLFMACAVICNPVLAVVYFVYTVCMTLYETTKKKNRHLFGYTEISFSITAWTWITLGIAAVAASFFVFIFSRTNMKEIMENLPMIFTDPEHEASDIVDLFFESLLDIVRINPYLFAAFSVLTFAVVADKKRITHRPFYLTAGTIILFGYVPSTTIFVSFPNYEYWVFPLAWLGLICYALTVNKNKNIFIFLWFFGVLYTVCASITSDTGFLFGVQGLLVSDVASVIFIKAMVDEMRSERKNNQNTCSKFERLNRLIIRITPILLTATLLLQIAQGFYLGANFLFYAESFDVGMAESYPYLQRNVLEKLNVTIQTGPQKGLKTTVSRAKIYTSILKDLDGIKQKGDGNILIAGLIPWAYLYLEMPYGTHSPWSLVYFFASIEAQRQFEYSVLHPENTPKYMYVSKLCDLLYVNMPDERARNILFEITQGYDYTVKESEYGYTVEIIGASK